MFDIVTITLQVYCQQNNLKIKMKKGKYGYCFYNVVVELKDLSISRITLIFFVRLKFKLIKWLQF